MRYYQEHSNEYLENGRAKLRIDTMDCFKRPSSPGRVIKVVRVDEVIRQSETNPIKPNVLLCVSFPEQRVNSRDYTWQRDEEKLVKVDLKLH